MTNQAHQPPRAMWRDGPGEALPVHDVPALSTPDHGWCAVERGLQDGSAARETKWSALVARGRKRQQKGRRATASGTSGTAAARATERTAPQAEQRAIEQCSFICQ